MLPASLVYVLNTTDTGETFPQWQDFINQSSVTATFIWNIAPTSVESFHASLDRVKVMPHPTLEILPHHQNQKSPSTGDAIVAGVNHGDQAARHSPHADLEAMSTALPPSALPFTILPKPRCACFWNKLYPN